MERYIFKMTSSSVFIHSPRFSSTCSVPGSALGPKDAAGDERNKFPAFTGLLNKRNMRL